MKKDILDEFDKKLTGIFIEQNYKKQLEQYEIHRKASEEYAEMIGRQSKLKQLIEQRILIKKLRKI